MVYIQNSFFRNMNRFFISLAVFSALVLMIGCAGGNYGTFDRDRELDNMYLRYEVLPDHNYYATGSYDAPAAILALKKDYELQDKANLWRLVPNVNAGQMRKWIDTIAPEQNYRRSNSYYAAYILDPNGKRIGAWYAIEPYTTVKFLGDNKVQVYTPNLSPEIRLNRGFIRGGDY